MRISDWSSDVCSSDLDDRGRFALPPELLTACPVLGPVPPLDDPLGARLAGGRIFEPTGAHVEADPSTFATAPVLERTGWWMSDRLDGGRDGQIWRTRSEEHTSELQSLMRISYAVFCLTKNHEDNYRTRQC